MQVLKKTITLGIVTFLIVWTVLLTIGPVVGGAIDANPASPPTLIWPANDTWLNNSKPTFIWNFTDPDPSDNQTGFNLQISTVTNFSVIIPNGNITVKSSTENHTLTTALDDGMYYWRVKTNDTNGDWSGWSDIWLVKIDMVAPSLSDDAPIGWQTTKPITVLLTVSDAGSGVYKVYYKKWLITEPVNYTEGTSIVLDTDGEWNIIYKGVDVAGNSAEKTKKVRIDTIPPNPVTNISVRILTEFEIRELEIGGQIIELTWTASNDLYFLRYEIYVSTDPSVIGTRIATITAIKTTYYDEIEIGPKGSENLLKGILDSGTTYYFSVVVVDQAGWLSEAATVSLKTTAPLNWPLMGGIAVAVEVAIAAIFIVIKLFIKKE